MTDFQVKQMTGNLKDICTQLKNINRTLGYIDKRLTAIDATLEKNGFAVLPTETEEKTYGEQIADDIIEKFF